MSDPAKPPGPQELLPLGNLLRQHAEGLEACHLEIGTPDMLVVVDINLQGLPDEYLRIHAGAFLMIGEGLLGHDLKIFEGFEALKASRPMVIEASIDPLMLMDGLDRQVLQKEPRRLSDERHWVNRKQAPASQRRESRKCFPQAPRRAKR